MNRVIPSLQLINQKWQKNAFPPSLLFSNSLLSDICQTKPYISRDASHDIWNLICWHWQTWDDSYFTCKWHTVLMIVFPEYSLVEFNEEDFYKWCIAIWGTYSYLAAHVNINVLYWKCTASAALYRCLFEVYPQEQNTKHIRAYVNEHCMCVDIHSVSSK